MSYDTDDRTPQYPRIAEILPRERAEIGLTARRRLALDVLSGQATPIGLDALATTVEAREAELDSTPEAATADAEIELHHVLLPKLDAAGVLDYDRERRVVESTDALAGDDGAAAPSSSVAGGRSTAAGELRVLVVAYFENSVSETASIADLSRHVVTRSSDATDLSAERVQMRLHHAVLPRLDDAGVLDYDPRTTTARYRQRSK